MKTIETVRQVVEREETLDVHPKYKVGQYMEVYCGQYEGHNFYIEDIRYNHDIRKFEYLYGGFMGGWYLENCVVPA